MMFACDDYKRKRDVECGSGGATMRCRAWVVVFAVAVLVACGGHGATTSGDGGTAGDSNGDATGGSAGWTVSYGAPATMFGLTASTIYRYSDSSGDGDYNESGERTVFFQGDANSQIVAVDKNTVLYITSAGQLEWLEDTNDNGTAMDPGETHTWWSGGLPGGGTGAAELMARTDTGAVFVLAGGMFYELVDSNANGTADDAGEITQVGPLPANVEIVSFAVDTTGDLWFVSTVSATGGGDLYHLHSGTVTLAIDNTTLDAASIRLSPSERAYTAEQSDGSVLATGTSNQREALFAIRDANADGQIQIDELKVVWTDADFDCPFYDLWVLDDGSVLGYTQNDIAGDSYTVRLVDGNHDGVFTEDGETYVNYDLYFATMNGQVQTAPFDSLAAATQ